MSTVVTTVMKTSIKNEWISRLVSGNYLQGQGWLNRTGPDGLQRFCCLGVLCEIAVMDGIVTREDNQIGSERFVSYVVPGELGRFSVIQPLAVARWAGLTPRGDSAIMLGPASAVSMNDHAKAPFSQIAAAIQRFL